MVVPRYLQLFQLHTNIAVIEKYTSSSTNDNISAYVEERDDQKDKNKK